MSSIPRPIRCLDPESSCIREGLLSFRIWRFTLRSLRSGGDKTTGHVQGSPLSAHMTLLTFDLAGLVFDETWMKVDDLQKRTTSFSCGLPVIPPSQIHIVMWEMQVAQLEAKSLPIGQHSHVSTITTLSTAQTIQPAAVRVVQAAPILPTTHANGYTIAATAKFSHPLPTPSNGIDQVLSTTVKFSQPPAPVAEDIDRVPATTTSVKWPEPTSMNYIDNIPAVTTKLSQTQPTTTKLMHTPVSTLFPAKAIVGDLNPVPPTANNKKACATAATNHVIKTNDPKLPPVPLKQLTLFDPALIGIVKPPQVTAALVSPLAWKNAASCNVRPFTPCTDTNLSRMDRLRLNADRLKALKSKQNLESSRFQTMPMAVSLPAKLPSCSKVEAIPTASATSCSPYMETVQPVLYNFQQKVAAHSKILGVNAAAKFQAFTFNPTTVSHPSSMTTILSKHSLISKVAAIKPIACKSTKFEAMDPGNSKMAVARRPRLSRTSQNAGMLCESAVDKPPKRATGKGRGCKTRGKSKVSHSIKNYVETNSLFEQPVQGDPTMMKAPDLESEWGGNTATTASEIILGPLSTPISEMAAATPCPLNQALMGAPLNPEQALKFLNTQPSTVVPSKSASMPITDLTSVASNIEFGKNVELDLFGDLNFDTEIDFTDLEFNLDEYLR